MAEPLRHVPWTCVWSSFGGPVEAGGAERERGEVFWTCHHPQLAPAGRLLKVGDCEACELWEPRAESAGPASSEHPRQG